MKIKLIITFDFEEMTKQEAISEISNIEYPAECIDAIIDSQMIIENEK